MLYLFYSSITFGVIYISTIAVVPMLSPKIENPRKVLIINTRRGAFVIPLGLEPRAPTLKVLCSTN